ncbi:hypothetical protein [Rhodovibrio sodomensis]|uniref:hypothetical protein n=1 Tax=Rhodovibrio sodomensis TaxID=1088 RepID=UPI0019050B8B|nr:hypothetical protein [Rhodovibrio sodomensis]
MARRGLSKEVTAMLAAGQADFPDSESWQAHLAQLGLDRLKVHPDPVRIAT